MAFKGRVKGLVVSIRGLIGRVKGSGRDSKEAEREKDGDGDGFGEQFRTHCMLWHNAVKLTESRHICGTFPQTEDHENFFVTILYL